MAEIATEIAPEKANFAVNEGSGASVDSEQVDLALERKLIRKIDLGLLPILLLLFLISFVDRANLANAKIEGLEKTLHMKGNDYNIALFIFTIPYVVLEVPSNLILQKVKPSIWLSSIMFGWGIASMCQGLTASYGGLLACRFIMGCFEAGFVPGCAQLIGSYYKRHEFQLRYSVFFSAAVLSGAFSGFLAYLLEKLNGVGGYPGWRWIFIIEGLITVVVAFGAFFIIAPWPQDCQFLAPAEKDLLLKRLAHDSGRGQMHRLDRKAFVRCLTDWKIWVGMFAYMGADNTASSITSFQPTILSELGYTASEAQIHTIPVYLVAMVASISSSWLSDRLSHRYTFCMAGISIAAVGWAIELAQAGTAGVRYFGMFCCTAGVYMLMPCLVLWLSNNMGGSYKRSIGTAFQIGGGNCAGLIASNVFITDQAPKYPVGFGVGFAMNAMSGVCCTILLIGLILENRKRDRGERNHRLDLPQEELNNLGDDHPEFRYTL